MDLIELRVRRHSHVGGGFLSNLSFLLCEQGGTVTLSQILFVNEVLGNYKDHLSKMHSNIVRPRKIRAELMALCSSLNNCIDYVAREAPSYASNTWNSRTADDLRSQLESNPHCIDGALISKPFWGYVRDIANVSKHVWIGRPDAIIKRADDVKESIRLVRYEDNRGYYYSYHYGIVAFTTAGRYSLSEIDIYFAVKSITEIFKAANLLPPTANPDIPKPSYWIARNEAEKKAPLELLVPGGQNLEPLMHTYKYVEGAQIGLVQITEQDEFTFTLNPIVKIEPNPI